MLGFLSFLTPSFVIFHCAVAKILLWIPANIMGALTVPAFLPQEIGGTGEREDICH